MPAPPDTPLIRIEDLAIAFFADEGRIDAVRGVGFDIMPGRTTALVGESGSGKSVISQAIMGILPPIGRVVRGRILFDDPQDAREPVDLAQLNPASAAYRRIRGGRISIVFQEPMTSLSPLHMVGDQIGEALHLHRKIGRAEGLDMVAEMLALVGFPDPRRALKTYPFELSGGLRQRAMIAMALICRPALLVADEPTTALDVTIQAQTLKLIKDLQAELGMAVLMITHDLGVVANVADYVAVMYHGRVMERGGIERIFSKPEHPYLKALLKAAPRFGMKPGERLIPLREVKHAPGGLMAERSEPWPEGADAAGPLLSVSGVEKSFIVKGGGLTGAADRQVKAVRKVSLDVARGECLGLVGESGCGKTTLCKIVMRALSPDAGAIAFNDRGAIVDVGALDGGDLLAFRRKIQFIFQDPFGSLNPRMTVFDIVGEPLVIHGVGDEESRRARVCELMALVGLDMRHLSRYPHSFSGGQRQRIGIARALALRPELLICDEPVSALDVSIQAQILNLLKDLQKELGLTYLFISHNLAVVDYIADRIAVMCAGRIVETAPRDLLFRNPTHPYTKALLAAVPDPDLKRPLDFAALMEGKASMPAAWPPPFGETGGAIPDLLEIEPGHFVQAFEPPKSRAA